MSIQGKRQDLDLKKSLSSLLVWCPEQELNLRPFGPQPNALSTELPGQAVKLDYFIRSFLVWQHTYGNTLMIRVTDETTDLNLLPWPLLLYQDLLPSS